MDSWTILNIILNIITIFNSVLVILISLGILLIIIIFHRQTRSVPILLVGYSCFVIFLFAIMLTSMCISSLFGFIGIDFEAHFNTVWCRWCGFFIHAFLCALYDLYSLQAIFRFCRVVVYRRKVLYSFNLYRIIIPIQIIFAVLCISPVLIWNRVAYLPSEFYCQTPFTDLPAILYIAGRLYGFPLTVLFGVYGYLVSHIRQTNSVAETIEARNRIQQNTRDLTVIKRLLIILILLVMLGLPSIVFLIKFLFTGYLLSITYRIGWISASFSLVFLTFMLIKFTTPLRDTIKRLINIRQHRILPQ